MQQRFGDYEIARRDPVNFWAKASQARYVAWCLWKLRLAPPPDTAACDMTQEEAVGALFMGWLRESSLALELIIKAALAGRGFADANFPSVPATHNIPQIWKMAKLPPLPNDLEYILMQSYQALQWSSRYAAPRAGAPDLFPEINRLRPERRSDRFDSGRLTRLDWDNFDLLFQIAQAAYFNSRRKNEVEQGP